MQNSYNDRHSNFAHDVTSELSKRFGPAIPELGAYFRNYSFELLNSGTEQIQTLRGTNAGSLEFSKDQYINSFPFENWSLSGEANDEEKDERNEQTHRKTKCRKQRKETEEKKRKTGKVERKKREEQRTLTYFFANISIAIRAPEVAPLTIRL